MRIVMRQTQARGNLSLLFKVLAVALLACGPALAKRATGQYPLPQHANEYPARLPVVETPTYAGGHLPPVAAAGAGTQLPPHLASRPSYPGAFGPTQTQFNQQGVFAASPQSPPAFQQLGHAEPLPSPLPQVFEDSTCCEPLPGCGSDWSRLIWHPPALGCGQFGCQRLWGDPNWDPEGFTLAGLARGYYLNDQRVEWSGLEATFGAEAALNPRYVRRAGDWLMRADGVFFLNQPFERNVLIDPDRKSYVANFYPDIFEIWQLNLAFTRGDFTVAVGKDRTPFGRYYFPIYSNSYFDSPFVRSEVIKWVETGIFLRYSPGPINLEVAATNGGVDRDTNSSKALVCRAGFDTPSWALGVSGKLQDGTGSEHQKLHNSYFGFDAMGRWGRFELSGEAVWDKYGFREVYDPNDIFWGRSIYYREIYNGEKDGSLSGFGYYLNLAWVYGRARIDLNYGEYYPEKIGNPMQDTINARTMLQGSLEVMPGVQTFLVLMGENDRPTEVWRRSHKGFVLYTGVQWLF
jgi:hypothetical protein